MYYILYPRNQSESIKVATKKPDPDYWKSRGYGFAEGPYKTIEKVIHRLNWMNISNNRRPDKLKFK